MYWFFFQIRAMTYQQFFTKLSSMCSVEFFGRKSKEYFYIQSGSFFDVVAKLDFIRAQMSIHWSLFHLSTWNWSITVHRVKFGKLFGWKLNAKSNRTLLFIRKIIKFRSRNQFLNFGATFSDKVCEKSLLMNFIWIQAKNVALILSAKFWTFLVDRLTGGRELRRKFSKSSFQAYDLKLIRSCPKEQNWSQILNEKNGKLNVLLSRWTFFVDRLNGRKEIQKNFLQKLFTGLCSQTDSTSPKEKIWAQFLNKKNGKLIFFYYFEQMLINKFSQRWYRNVQWSFWGRKF